MRDLADRENWAVWKERKQEDRRGKEVGLPQRQGIG